MNEYQLGTRKVIIGLLSVQMHVTKQSFKAGDVGI